MNASPTRHLLPHVQDLDERLSCILNEAYAILPNFTDAQWNWSLNRQTWSAALVCDHLNRGAELMNPLLENAVEQARAAGKLREDPYSYSRIERVFIRFVSPNPPFKVPVPPVFAPKPVDDPREAGRRFLQLHDVIRIALRDSNGLDMCGVTIASPASKRIRFSAAAWFKATVAHTEYHWLQVKALHAHPEFPAPD